MSYEAIYERMLRLNDLADIGERTLTFRSSESYELGVLEGEFSSLANWYAVYKNFCYNKRL